MEALCKRALSVLDSIFPSVLFLMVEREQSFNCEIVSRRQEHYAQVKGFLLRPLCTDIVPHIAPKFLLCKKQTILRNVDIFTEQGEERKSKATFYFHSLNRDLFFFVTTYVSHILGLFVLMVSETEKRHS